MGGRSRELSSDLLEEGKRTERPTEIWVYNQYPDYFSGPLHLEFVDYESTGDYKLSTDVEVKPFYMMTHVMSDPDMMKYQWIGKIEKDESSPGILPFLDYSKALGKIEKDKKENYSVDCFFEIPLGNIRCREANGQYKYNIDLSIKVENMETKGSYQEKKEIRKSLSLENLRKNIKEGYSLSERNK